MSDDIPMAQRAVLPWRGSRRSARQRLSIVVLAAGLVLALVLGVAITAREPVGGSSGLARLGLKPDPNGRLLGHFPYQEVNARDLVSIAPGLQLHKDAAQALLTMQAAARADGVDLVVLSAYRSVALQDRLFFDVKSARNQTAKERARVSAPPGYSEHSTGYAVDLGDAGAPGTNLSASFDQTAAFAWLQANAPRYQFTLSFPRGNAQGVNYEPWHWRFEGTAQALRVFEPAQRLTR